MNEKKMSKFSVYFFKNFEKGAGLKHWSIKVVIFTSGKNLLIFRVFRNTSIS